MAEHLEDKTPSAPASSPLLWRVGGAVAIAIAGVAITWAVVWRNGSNSPTATYIKPVALSASGLRTLAALVPQPIYWAGLRKDYLYELTRKTNGYVYIRYLPRGVKAGAPGSKYLIIATYPVPRAYKTLLADSHGRQLDVPGGGVALVNSDDPKSVLIAFPGSNYEVEVYDPSPAVARSVALSDVRPAG